MPETLRRFGWIQHKSGETADFRVFTLPLSAETMAEFEAVTGVITFLQPLATAFAICRQSHMALQAKVPAQEAELNASGISYVSTTTVLDLLLDTAAGISAFLGAASALLGHLEGALKRKWGETSSEYAAWDAKRKSRHAGSSGYRLMYELRNFSQHHGVPLSSFSIDGTRQDPDGPMTFSVRPSLDRDTLLATSFNWKGRRAELQASQPLIDVLPLIHEYFDCLRGVVHDAVVCFQDELTTCNDYLGVLRNTFQPPPDATLAIFHGESASPETPPARVTIVPELQFAWMLRILRDTVPAAP
jgi:hypothetical protein